ncbi:MAG: hypothetical protein K8L91_26015 [Anaerolineae bacterium]|nr:hypothetical protein [Anaerolineae bacterium]
MRVAKAFVLSLAVIVAFALAVTSSHSVAAHEGRQVGPYTIEIGWRVEPAYTGLINGPEITIFNTQAAADHSNETEEHEDAEGEHVEGAETEVEGSLVMNLEDTLQIDVSFGPATKTLHLRSVPGKTGHYVADLIPTRPGDYTFRLVGTIEDLEVDETFSSTDGEFSTADPISDLQFPEPDDLQDQIDSLRQLIEELEARLPS